MTVADLAVYTTVYPGVEPYLVDWYGSLRRQIDQAFQLWIGVDQLTIHEVVKALGESPDAIWVTAEDGDSPAQVRQRALARIAEDCRAVVLVDSDDMLHPERVSAARRALSFSPVTACALQLMDVRGADLRARLTLPTGSVVEDVLPRRNIFGLSNTAYTSEALDQCLPIPSEAALVDWFLITRAWLRGIPISFDTRALMGYRQYGANTAQVLPPFTAERVRRDTALVVRHIELIESASSADDLPERTAAVQQMAADVGRFQRNVLGAPSRLATYVTELNLLDVEPLWWSSVAHPALRDLWRH